MKTGLAGTQSANIRTIKRRNRGSAPAYALDNKQHNHCRKVGRRSVFCLTIDNHIRGEPAGRPYKRCQCNGVAAMAGIKPCPFYKTGKHS